MSGQTGDDAPGDSGPRAAGGRAVVRSEGGAGESGAMAAADTAVALPTPAPGGTSPGQPTETHAASESGRARAAHVEENLIGATLLGRYTILRQIGKGGMGVVYEATHMLIGKRVAIKILLDKYARKEQIVARLEQEARLASAIGHEHIIDITDFGQTDDGRTFVVMEFLEGESLGEILVRERTLPEPRLLAIAIQVAGALGAAHAKGIIHRDVKPENVFVLRRKDRDFVKVVDFGISKSLRTVDSDDDSPRLTQTGMVLGTPLYMSPEQARGDEELDARIDVYALGVIMYEMATGRPPFTGVNYLSIIAQVLNEEAKPPRAYSPELSDELESVILRAIDKDRDRRYQSTEELLADLTALHDDPTHSTQRARISGPRRRFRGRGPLRTLAWVAVVGGIIAAVAIIVTVLLGGTPGRRQAVTEPVVAIDAGVALSPPLDATPAPTVAIATIKIETTPSGATLYEGGRELGVTPFEGEWPLRDETLTLIASKAGYDDAECTVRIWTDNGKVARCRLAKTKVGRPPVIRRPTRPGSGSGSGAGSGSATGPAGGGEWGTPVYPRPPP